MSAFRALSSLSPDSRPAGHPVAIAPAPQDSLAWQDLWRGVAALRAHIAARPCRRWVLYTESTPLFLMGLLALLQAGRQILLPANLQAGTVAEAGGPEAGLLDEGAIARILNAGGAPDSPGAGDPQRAELLFHTSGSTGSPKIVPKRLSQIEREIENLHALWGAELEGRRVRSSVSHQHIYGFLFTAVLPLSLGLPVASERIASPRALEGLRGEASLLVLSPAFLKRAVQARAEPLPLDPRPVVFSSGGVLPRETAEAAARIFGVRPREIYGSTETGGIAYRSAGGEEPWKCFPGVRIRIAGDSRIEVRSPYLPDDGYLATGDTGSLLSPDTFTLSGRLDSIVKIEEKRVSLDEVEGRLRESPLVEDAHVLALERARQFLAAVLVLSPAGRSRFASASRRELTSHFRAHLLAWFEPTVLPRKWRFVESIPRDAQGKAQREAVLAMFGREGGASRSRDPEVAGVEREGSRLAVRLRFPADSVYFDGHFPSFRLLPAVAQLEWALRFSRQLGVTEDLEEIVRLKFSRPILPGVPLRLELQREEGGDRLDFRYVHQDTAEVFSSGRLKLRGRA